VLGFGVLGPLEVTGAPVAPAGERQRGLLALLLAHGGRVVAADALAEALFADRPPANPAAALQSQVSRLRRVLGDTLVSAPRGYAVRFAPDQLDAARFELLLRRARTAPQEAADLLTDALGLWRGPAYAEFAELETVRLEAIRLDELRLTATEELAEALLARGRGAEVVPLLEPFVAANPLRERAHAALLRALYAAGRQADALRHYATHREHLTDELGLEPSVALQRLELDILRHGVDGPADVAASPAALDRLQVHYVRRPDGNPVAVATIGQGPALMAVPAWVTSLELVRSGRDPRASLLERLARHTRLTMYDRLGTGLSRGARVPDHGLDASVAELEAVLESERSAGSPPAALLGMSQAGPVAVALAARRPDLVRRLVLFGTYADGPATFPSAELRTAAVGLVRSHARLGTGMLAELYRPGAGSDAARHLAAVLRDSADPADAAEYLAAVYRTDVTDLLADVAAPSLVLHYRGDRVVPFRGGRQLATGLRDARFLPLDGSFHLPDARDLDAVVAAVLEFVS
jgi:DNA-binding SARP family transcriptional activator/pimeloyl-ACP methyl ester carboxylesterase